MKTKKYILLLLLMLFAGILNAQVSEYEYKAAFIERFTRFVEWPPEVECDTFKIAIFGESPINTALDELFDGIKVKGKDVVLIYTDEIEDLSEADLVFISSSEKRYIEEVVTILRNKPILIIGDSKGLCEKGGHINMFVEGNYIRYEINQSAIEKSGLSISSLLLASAKIIKTDD